MDLCAAINMMHCFEEAEQTGVCATRTWGQSIILKIHVLHHASHVGGLLEEAICAVLDVGWGGVLSIGWKSVLGKFRLRASEWTGV